MRPGEDLMNLVLKALDIREGAFFGLTYKSFEKKESWLRLRPKVSIGNSQQYACTITSYFI